MEKQEKSDRRPPDEAVARRLGKLRHRPLDMTALSHRVKEAVSGSSATRKSFVVLSPFWLVAASLLLVGAIVTVLLTTSGAPILVSVSELSEIHRDNVLGNSEAIAVDSMQSAGQVLAAQWKDCPHLPDGAEIIVGSCHVHRLCGKRLACLSLKLDGRPVTLAVAHAGDIRLPQTSSINRDGFNYYVESFENVKIVITQRDGLWLCMMGDLPTERLLENVASLRI